MAEAPVEMAAEGSVVEPYCLSATAAAAELAAGRLSAKALVSSCYKRIRARERTVHAWQHLDRTMALATAGLRDREPSRGPLHGLPVGVKDIIDTADMPTEYGTPIYAGHRPAVNAACVEKLRAAGAIIAGKTVTTELAYFTPGKTVNPHRPGHTPGGSSSGSAAAVADYMVPLAIGTQTAGSVTRPAAFCGVVGFKGSFGWTSMVGVKPFAPALDTLGVFARSVADAALIAGALAEQPLNGAPAAERPPRIGLCRTGLWARAEPATRDVVEAAARQLAAVGAVLHDIDPPWDADALVEAQMRIMAAEAVHHLAEELRSHNDRLSGKLLELLGQGREIDVGQLDEAHGRTAAAKRRTAALMQEYDLLLTPAAVGEAPAGLKATGDPLFNRIWTLLGVPCLSLPWGKGPNGLPLAIQLVGAAGRDGELLRFGAWVERHLT